MVESDSFFGYGGKQALLSSALQGYEDCSTPEQKRAYIEKLTPQGKAYFYDAFVESFYVENMRNEPLPLIDAVLTNKRRRKDFSKQ